MAGYAGDIRLGDTIDIKFCTVTTTGAPTTLASSPVVSAYPGNSTTEITAGITLSVDFDSRTGLNNVRVVASGGNGYATQTNYSLVITTGTVGGTSVVGYEIGSFSIENRSALMPTTAARTLDVSAGGEGGVDWANVGSPTTTVNLSGTSTKAVEPTVAGRTLDVSAGGEAGLDWANIGSPTTAQNLSGTSTKALEPTTAGRTLDVTATGEAGIDWANIGAPTTTVNLSGTTIAAVTGAVGSVTGAVGSVIGNVGGNVVGSVGSVVGAVGSVTGAVGSVTGNVGGNVVGSVASVTGNVGGNVTGSVGSVVGAVGSVTGNVGGNVTGSVGSVATGGIAAASFAANAITAAALAADAVDEIWDEVVDGSATARQSLRLHNSAEGGKVAGAATSSVTIRDLADTKNRVTATVDADGNRTAVTLDLT